MHKRESAVKGPLRHQRSETDASKQEPRCEMVSPALGATVALEDIALTIPQASERPMHLRPLAIPEHQAMFAVRVFTAPQLIGCSEYMI